MKNLVSLLIVVAGTILFVQCKKECEIFTTYPINEKLKPYFDTYSPFQRVVFTSTKNGRNDTLKILSIVTDTSKRVRDIDSCQWSLSKKTIFHFKVLAPNDPILCEFGSGEYMYYNKMDSTLKIMKDLIFSLGANKKSNTIFVGADTGILPVNNIRINNILFKEVLAIKSLPTQMTLYFAPVKGLIRVETPLDTFNIQN